MLQRVKRSVLYPNCPECGTKMNEVSDAPATGGAEYECEECGETIFMMGNAPRFGRPTRN